MMIDNIGVHVTHCCKLHGCKYGSLDCPVAKGHIDQQYICETCSDMGIKSLQELDDVIHHRVDVCSHCGHVS